MQYGMPMVQALRGVVLLPKGHVQVILRGTP